MTSLYLPELREALAEDNADELREFCTALNPGRTAEFMEGLEDGQLWLVLQHAEATRRAEVFSYFDIDRQIAMLTEQPVAQVAELVAEIPPDDRVDLLQELDSEREDQILSRLSLDDRRDIQRLRSYEDDTAGSLMTTDVAKLRQHLSVQQALEELSRQSNELETIYYLYVVDENELLRGIVSTRQLVSSLSRPKLTLGEIMESDVITVLESDDQEAVAKKVERFNLLAIPVVDTGRRLLGIITHDDVIDVVREELAEDAQRIAAVAPLDQEYLRVPLLTLAWKRGLWLTILFFAALLTAFALQHYEEELAMYAWLIAFIPLIISSGGNSGSQSATLVITAMTSGDVNFTDWPKVVWRELAVSLMLGGFLGTIGMLVALKMAPSTIDAWVIPLTLVSIVVAGCLCGVSLPMVFKRLGLDPAMMSNPFVAGIVDILGIVIYINIARWILG
ncbi:MAG: magnesium transporter [Planctomycetota bacterium]